jgi:hypothetical protein
MKVSSNGLTNIRCCMYSFWAPDDGRKNRLEHVEHFAEINELCNVASCWLYLEIKSYIYVITSSNCPPREIRAGRYPKKCICKNYKFVISCLRFWIEEGVSKIKLIPYVRNLKPLNDLTSSSSYICHGVGPLVDPFRSHVSRSLFKLPPWFLLPVGQ